MASRPKAHCPHCGQLRSVSKDGTLIAHIDPHGRRSDPYTSGDYCEGSHKTVITTPPPVEGSGDQPVRLSPSQNLLQYFKYSHLPKHLQDISRPCAELAEDMAVTLPEGTELTFGLRQLLLAKDAFVRAAL